MGVLLDMLNSTYFQDPKAYRALAIVTHKLIVNDLGDYVNISGCVHSTLCHGDLCSFVMLRQNLVCLLGSLQRTQLKWATRTANNTNKYSTERMTLVKKLKMYLSADS